MDVDGSASCAPVCIHNIWRGKKAMGRGEERFPLLVRKSVGQQNYHSHHAWLQDHMQWTSEQWISLKHFLWLFVKSCLCCSSHKHLTITSITKCNIKANSNMDSLPRLCQNLVWRLVYSSSMWGWGLMFPVLFLAPVYCHRAAQQHQSTCYQWKLALSSQYHLKWHWMSNYVYTVNII